ncbi:hypothetical protein THAOC_03859, partial [Thalassiosira oceanica]
MIMQAEDLGAQLTASVTARGESTKPGPNGTDQTNNLPQPNEHLQQQPFGQSLERAASLRKTFDHFLFLAAHIPPCCPHAALSPPSFPPTAWWEEKANPYNQFNSQLSKTQKTFASRQTAQISIINTISNTKELAIVTCATGSTGNFEVLHHISTEHSAAAGGTSLKPTVFCGLGLREATLGVWTEDHYGWTVLKKFSKEVLVPSVPDILHSVDSGLSDEPEGGESFYMPAFIILNGRALEKLDEMPDKSYQSLLLALSDLAGEDLKTYFADSLQPGEEITADELAQRLINNREEAPYGAQLQAAYAWWKNEGADLPAGYTPTPESEMSEGMRRARQRWEESLNELEADADGEKREASKRPPKTQGTKREETVAEKAPTVPATPSELKVGQTVIATAASVAHFGTVTRIHLEGTARHWPRATNQPAGKASRHQSPAGKPPATQPSSLPKKRKLPDIAKLCAPDVRGTEDGGRPAGRKPRSIRREDGAIEELEEKKNVSFTATNDGMEENPYRRGGGFVSGAAEPTEDQAPPIGQANDPSPDSLLDEVTKQLLSRLGSTASPGAPAVGLGPGAPAAAAIGNAPPPQPSGGSPAVRDDVGTLLSILGVQTARRQAEAAERLSDHAVRQANAIEQANALHASDADLKRRGAKHVPAHRKQYLLTVTTTTGHSPAPSLMPLTAQLLGMTDKNNIKTEFGEKLSTGGRQEVFINNKAADALSTGILVGHHFEPANIGFYTVSNAPFRDPTKASVVSTTNGLVKLTKATLKLATKTFGPTSYPEMFFKRAQELAEEKDGEIEDVMRNFDAPNLQRHVFRPPPAGRALPPCARKPTDAAATVGNQHAHQSGGPPRSPGPEAPPRPPPQRPQRPPPMMFQQPPPQCPARHPLPPNQPQPVPAPSPTSPSPTSTSPN